MPVLFKKDQELFDRFWKLERPADLDVKLFKVTIDEIKKIRSLDQNAYLHWLFNYIATYANNGMSPEEVKWSYKFKFLLIQTKPFIRVRSTSDLSTKEMSLFWEWIWADAWEYYRLYCPRPDEINIENWKN